MSTNSVNKCSCCRNYIFAELQHFTTSLWNYFYNPIPRIIMYASNDAQRRVFVHCTLPVFITHNIYILYIYISTQLKTCYYFSIPFRPEKKSLVNIFKTFSQDRYTNLNIVKFQISTYSVGILLPSIQNILEIHDFEIASVTS